MKFIHYLESIAGIGIYPLISLLIFFSFFVALVFYVKRLNKESVTNLANIPLEPEDNTKTLK